MTEDRVIERNNSIFPDSKMLLSPPVSMQLHFEFFSNNQPGITFNSETILVKEWFFSYRFYLNLVVIIPLALQQCSYLVFYANINISSICCISPYEYL